MEPSVLEHTTPPLLDQAIATFLGVPVATVWTVPHQLVTRLAVTWAGTARWPPKRAKYKRQAGEKRMLKGKKRIENAATAWARENGVISSALDQVQWKNISRIPGTSSYRHSLLHRLKLRALSLWVPTLKRQACPHAECIHHVNISLSHVFWECPYAQRRWKTTRSIFAQLDTESNAPSITEIFSCRLTYPPGKCVRYGVEWAEQNSSFHKLQTTDAVHAVVNKYWSFAVVETLASIWRARVDTIYSTTAAGRTTNERDASFHARLQTGFDTVASTFKLDRKNAGDWASAMDTRKRLRQQNSDDIAAPRGSPAQPEHYVGFFDGGSRGNPGPGGSGSVLIQVDECGVPRIVWLSSISLLRPTCTNNFAEFNGLLRLLHHVDQRKLKQVHIVGDSQLVLRMMRERRRPKARVLQPIYDRARRLADSVRVASWSHHYRCHNKMADCLANLAMDSRRSQQDEPMDRDLVERRYPGVPSFLMNDYRKWADTNTGQEILMPSSL